MSNELHAEAKTGLTVYCVLLSSTNTVWNGSAFVALSGVTWTDADIAMTEAKAGVYLATMPTSTAGAYSYVAYKQAGGTPAVTDSIVGTGYINWSGTAEWTFDDLPTAAEVATATLAAGGTITLSSPASADGSLMTLTRGDDYSATDGREIDFSGTDWPTLTGATITCTVKRGKITLISTAGSVVTGTGTTKTVRVELTAAQTGILPLGSKSCVFDIQATLTSARIVTLVRGDVTVLEDYT